MKTLIKRLYGWELTPWFGNSDLGIISYLKELKNPFNGRKTKVWIWISNGIYSYTVNAGSNSEYSYTGGFETQPENMSEAIITIEDMYANNLIFK